MVIQTTQISGQTSFIEIRKGGLSEHELLLSLSILRNVWHAVTAWQVVLWSMKEHSAQHDPG